MLFWYSIHKTWGAISIWVELGLVSLNLGVVSALKFLKTLSNISPAGVCVPFLWYLTIRGI